VAAAAISPESQRSGGAEKRPRIQSVARAADVLSVVAASFDGLAPREISDKTGLPRQTVYHLVHTLVESRLLRRGAEDRLVLGIGVGALAAAFQKQLGPQEQLRPYVGALADRTGEVAYASGWIDDEITVLAVARGSSIVQARDVVVGNSEDAYARASGKLLLAHAPDGEQTRYLDSHQLRRRTNRTKTDRKTLRRDFDEIRQRGYAVDLEEFAEGLCCIAVPLASTPYVIGISMPAARFKTDRDRYVDICLEVAAENLG
jgi:IclR family acetate operon transcriptional repressor